MDDDQTQTAIFLAMVVGIVLLSASFLLTSLSITHRQQLQQRGIINAPLTY